MPWLSWPSLPETIKKRACRFLMQHYIGKFLQEQLQLEQLSINMLHGKGCIKNLQLDVCAVNELLNKMHAPVEVLEGSIDSISVSIPWTAIFRESCEVEVKGIHVTALFDRVNNGDLASMTDSFCNSIRNMTTSMEFAQECFKNKEAEPQLFEGLEVFAEAVESVLSRIKLTFTDTTLCFEHSISPSLDIGLQITISYIKYFDEDDYSTGTSNETPSYPKSKDNPIHGSAFACKQFRIAGISVSVYQCPEEDQDTSEIKLNANDKSIKDNELPSQVIANFFGEQQIKLRVKQDEQVSGPKVDVDMYFNYCCILLMPKNVQQLLLLANHLTSSHHSDAYGEPAMKSYDTPFSSFDYKSNEEQFHMSDCLSSNNVEDHAFKTNRDLYQYSTKKCLPSEDFASIPLVSDPEEHTNNHELFTCNTTCDPTTIRARAFSNTSIPLRAENKTTIGFASYTSENYNDSFANVYERFQCQMKFGAISIMVLHEDPACNFTDKHSMHLNQGCKENRDIHDNRLASTCTNDMAVNYFCKTKQVFENHSLGDIFQNADLLNAALVGHNHLAFLLGPVHLECEKNRTTKLPFSVKALLNVSIGNVGILECLYEHDHLSTKDELRSTFVDVLVFPQTSKKSSKEQCVRLKVDWKDVGDCTSTVLDVKLSDFKSEVDITIVDRISTLLSLFVLPNSLQSENINTSVMPELNSPVLNKQALFQQLVDGEKEPKSTKFNVAVFSSELDISFRFPIPDLRQDTKRNSSNTRSLRPEILHIIAKDLSCTSAIYTKGNQHHSTNAMRDIKFQFHSINALYSDEEKRPPKLFLEATSSDYGESTKDIPFGTNLEMNNPCIQINFRPMDHHNPLLLPDNMQFHSCNDQQTNDAHTANGASLFESHSASSRKPSPFSSCKEMYGNTEMVLPGNKTEMQDFVNHTKATSGFHIALHFPVVKLCFPSMLFVENIYNRINNDLLLWTPKPMHTTQSWDCANIPSKLDFASQFFSTQSTLDNSINDEDDATMRSSGSTVNSNEDISGDPHKSLHRSCNLPLNQSFFTISLDIKDGLLSLCSELDPKLQDNKIGQLFLKLQDGFLFNVCGYQGNPNLDYTCFEITSFSFYHKVHTTPVLAEFNCFLEIPTDLKPVLYQNEDGVTKSFFTGRQNGPQGDTQNPCKMIAAAFKVKYDEDKPLKEIMVALLIQGVTVRHQFLPPGHSWLDQVLQISTIQDEEVIGYEPPSMLIEVHFHVRKCAVVYQPLYLTPSLRSVATVQSCSLACNVVVGSPVTVIQIIVDDASLYISESYNCENIDLRKYFVCVLRISLLELCLKLKQSEKNDPQDFPLIEFSLVNNKVVLETCADSCAAFFALLRYIAGSGDLIVEKEKQSQLPTCTTPSDKACSSQNELHSSLQDDKQVPSTSDAQANIASLMADAMREVNLNENFQNSNLMRNSCNKQTLLAESEIFSKKLQSKTCERLAKDESFSDGEEDFCIISDDNLDQQDFEPKVEYFTESTHINCVENHFGPILGKVDHLKAPQHYPTPMQCYTIKELSCSWYMYGGNDLNLDDEKESKTVFRHCFNLPECERYSKKPTLKQQCGRGKKSGRNGDILVEFHVSKIRFRHEVYHEDSSYVSRSVCTIAQFEILDRLKSSLFNKFLKQYVSESNPKQSQANMLLVKLLLTKPDQIGQPINCRLKVALQPLKLSIDQDTLYFVIEFFTTFCSLMGNTVVYENDTETSGSTSSDLDVSTGTNGSENVVFAEQHTGAQSDSPPLYYHDITFSPDVPIRLDYYGKHIDIDQGKIAGLLIGLGQLNGSQLKLRRIVHRHGLLGIERVFNFVRNEWGTDIFNNQLPSILGGVGAMQSVVKVFQGVCDLVWMPLEQYRRDGRVMRGLQRGTSSFGTSTSMAVLEITNRFVGLVQTAAETAYDVFSPADNSALSKRNWYSSEKKVKLVTQPSDMREGFNTAIAEVHHGISDAACSIARVAQKEHEQRGVTGAVGGILRHMPVTLVRPVIAVSKATSNVLSGMRNQMAPDAKQDDEDKWRIYAK